jgi:hypothetical protein
MRYLTLGEVVALQQFHRGDWWRRRYSGPGGTRVRGGAATREPWRRGPLPGRDREGIAAKLRPRVMLPGFLLGTAARAAEARGRQLQLLGGGLFTPLKLN